MLFSVITVTLNNLAGLKKTAASLRLQTCRDYEWRVVDGDSDDGSAAWLAGTGAQWRSEPDEGLYHAMNKGLDVAQGDYLLFLNAGDTLAAPDILERLAADIRSSEKEGTVPAFIYGDSLEERPGQPPAYKPARSHKAICQNMITHHQAMLYRREALSDLRFDSGYSLAADYDLTARFLQTIEDSAILYVRAPVCLYEAGGLSQQHVRTGRREQFLIRQRLGLCPVFQNYLIRLLQTATMALRSIAPALYWTLKSRTRNGADNRG